VGSEIQGNDGKQHRRADRNTMGLERQHVAAGWLSPTRATTTIVSVIERMIVTLTTPYPII